MIDIDLRSLPGYTSSRLAFYGMAEQALAGVQFDKGAAEALVVRIDGMMRSIEEEVEPKLPPRGLKKSEQALYTLPAKPYKKDGTLAASMLKWIEKIRALGLEASIAETQDKVLWIDGGLYDIVGNKELPATMPMTLANQDQIKEYLLEEGWSPTLWNFKKDKRGKPVRDDRGKLIRTSPKFQENKKLCSNLEAMSGPVISQIVTWLSLRNRRSTLSSTTNEETGWLNNDRLAFDGRLSAGASGFTSTFRFKGSVIVNVPKAEEGVTLGKEMRALFTARPGNVLVGFDASALENRVEAHYCYPYEGGKEYADEILNGDPHYKNAFVFYPEQLADLGFKFGEVSKDEPKFKPYRSRAKNGRYCLSYGGGPPKLATTLQLPASQGEQLYEAFWEANYPLKKFRDVLTQFWETTGEKKWIRGIDGRRVHTRSKHSVVNTAFQSTGACVMEIADLFMCKQLGGWQQDDQGYPCFKYKGHYVYRVIFQHDEFEYDCPPEVADEIGKMGCDAITKAGQYLKMRVPLGGSYSVGLTWRDVH